MDFVHKIYSKPQELGPQELPKAMAYSRPVTPANPAFCAGRGPEHIKKHWIPASAGMTESHPFESDKTFINGFIPPWKLTKCLVAFRQYRYEGFLTLPS
jgi:hypothetical protein